MKLLRGVVNLPNFADGVVATIGNFDGVHLGHQNLLNALKKEAKKRNLPSLVIMFEPQPREYFQQEKAPARLASVREKIKMLQDVGVDYVYCMHFNAKIASTSAVDFANNLLFSLLKVKYILVGEDFHFGQNRQGDVALLGQLGAEHGCSVAVYSDFKVGQAKVSSSKIREALDLGLFDLAAQYLGRPYSICGRILAGDQRGRQWGIPTANVSLKRISIPLHGVFVVEALVAGKTHKGVANIGNRPTVDGSKNVLEVHLFDFNDSIYGELMQVTFLHKIRGEVKFTTVDALIDQIHRDIAQAKEYFKQKPEHA